VVCRQDEHATRREQEGPAGRTSRPPYYRNLQTMEGEVRQGHGLPLFYLAGKSRVSVLRVVATAVAAIATTLRTGLTTLATLAKAILHRELAAQHLLDLILLLRRQGA